MKITKDGKVFLNDVELRQGISGRDRKYKVVHIKNKTHYVHRLVAEKYIPNPDNKPCVNHINGIKDDNRVENLEWVTYSENTNHAYDNDLLKLRKLTFKQIEEIRMKYIPFKYSIPTLAKEYGVGINTIHSILQNKTYKRKEVTGVSV